MEGDPGDGPAEHHRLHGMAGPVEVPEADEPAGGGGGEGLPVRGDRQGVTAAPCAGGSDTRVPAESQT